MPMGSWTREAPRAATRYVWKRKKEERKHRTCSLRPSASSLARTKKQIRFSVTLFLPLPAFAHLSSTPYALKYSITIASWRRRIQARGARYSDEVRFLSRLIFSPSPKRRERGEEGEREREAEKKLGPLVLASPLQRCLKSPSFPVMIPSTRLVRCVCTARGWRLAIHAGKKCPRKDARKDELRERERVADARPPPSTRRGPSSSLIACSSVSSSSLLTSLHFFLITSSSLETTITDSPRPWRMTAAPEARAAARPTTAMTTAARAG